MITGAFPLLHENHKKKSSHGKINAFRIKRNQISSGASDDAAENPVAAVSYTHLDVYKRQL